MEKFRLYGNVYEVPDMEELSTRELRTIKEHSGMGLRPLLRGLEDLDPDALVSMVFIAKLRAGEKVAWSDFDEMRITDIEDVDEPESAEGQSNPPTDTPTELTGSGTSRTRGSTATSRSSRTTSTSTPDK